MLLPDVFNDYSVVDKGPYEIPEMKLNIGAVVLDCGASLGLFSAYAASQDCTVYSFEPIPNSII